MILGRGNVTVVPLFGLDIKQGRGLFNEKRDLCAAVRRRGR